jgi:hypothetical protein
MNDFPLLFTLWFVATAVSAIVSVKMVNTKKNKGSMFIMLALAIVLFITGIYFIATALILWPLGILCVIGGFLLLILRGAMAHNWSTTWDITELFNVRGL